MNKYSNNELAAIVKKAWENILQKNDVKEDDHFFLLGGDSLLASMLILSLDESMPAEISLGDLYDNPTLKEFSAFIERQL